MDPNSRLAPYVQQIATLIELLGGQGADLDAKIASLAQELPEDLNTVLGEFRQSAVRLGQENTGGEDVADFAFRCGRLVERLEHFRKSRVAENLVFVGPEGQPSAELQNADVDRLSRFLAARDRVLRKAADLSLKVLAVATGLFILAFLFGLI